MVVKRLGPVLGCAVIATTSVAHAQVDNTGVLDQALKQYRTAAEAWQSAAHGAATTLFWSLATISLVWTMGQLVLRRAELGEFFGELVRYLLFTGFWAWMLNNGPAHAQLIIESMINLAGGASGQNMMSPSGVLDVGFHLVDRALTQSSILSPLDSAIGIVLALVILVVLALVGVNMLVTLIACWIVAYGGVIVLGFGGSRWTSDMAINYYRMVLSLGLQVLAMVLLVGIGESFLRGYYSALEKNVSLHEQAVLLVVSIVLLVTVNRVPALLGTLANGSSPQYALGSGAGPGAALSTASAAGALAATASRPVLEGAGQLAKAAAVAAIGGTGAAAASLVDGFRSRDAERSSSAGGSVFPVPAPPAPTQERVAQQAASGTVPAEDRSLAPVPGANQERSARAAEQSPREDRAPEHDHEVRNRADSPREAPARSRSGDEDGAGAEPSARPGAQHAKADGPHGGAAEPTNPHAQERSDAAPNVSEQRTRTAPDSPSKTERPDPSASIAPAGRRSDASSRHSAADVATGSLPSTSSPAGTFAQGPSAVHTTPPIAAGSPVASSAASTTAPTPRSTAPTSALAAAIRAAASPTEIPFSIPTTGDALSASGAPAPSATAEPSDRAELPAAYSQHTTVDVEAEVAAFRDRD